MPCALQFDDVALVGNAFAVLGKPVSKYIGHQCHIYFFTDGAQSLGWFTNIASSANEFWVSITHRVTTNTSSFDLVDNHAARKLMVDNADITSQHVDGETHGLTR